MLMDMDNNSSTKNIVVVQDITNGLGHVIESETSGRGREEARFC